MDVGLVRLTYGMDYGPPVNDTKWTKPKKLGDQTKNLGGNFTPFRNRYIYRLIGEREKNVKSAVAASVHPAAILFPSDLLLFAFRRL